MASVAETREPFLTALHAFIIHGLMARRYRAFETCRRLDCERHFARYSNPRGAIEHAMLRVRGGSLVGLLF